MKNIKAKIITVATMKGGTGKTTICFNIAGILAEKYKVTEIPVVMNEREEGVSSISLKNSVYYMIKVSFAILIARMKK